VGKTFAGTFEHYAASIIAGWQRAGDPCLEQLGKLLGDLGLTSQVTAQQSSATQVSLLVERLPGRRGSGAADLVNMADVGFGVSQVLPVLVALLAAEPGRLVYIEQPELHLHPRAQQALAAILADTAMRGVQVVVETHSSTLLLALQALTAAGRLSQDLVKLHWFSRESSGVTEVESADLDRFGAYGDWPEDFGEVQAGVESRYLDAVEAAAFGKGRNGRRKTNRR
jgi:predicted ATPase